MSEILTIAQAGKMTTYQLRQELVKRNALDLPEDRINHRNMLERLVQELVKEELHRVNEAANLAAREIALKQEEAKRIREEKKQEALERSRQRQVDAEYFQKKAAMNEAAKQPTATSITENTTDNTAEVDSSPIEEDSDPFRSYNSKQRSKIFIK